MAMQTSSLVLMSGCAALVTAWVLRTAPPSRPPVIAVASETSVFLADRYQQLVADGSCQMQSDAGTALLAPLPSDAPIEEAASAPDAVAGPDAAVEVAASAPLGGSCGGHLEPSAEHLAGSADDMTLDPEPTPEVVDVEPPAVAASDGGAEVAKKKVATETRRASSAPTADKPRPRRAQAPSQPLTAWWPASNADQLNILFVGEAAFGSAISVLADGEFENAESANAHVQVRTVDGARVERKWQLSTNRKMLLMSVGPGEYTVSIGADLSDAKSRTFGRTSEGRVFVR